MLQMHLNSMFYFLIISTAMAAFSFTEASSAVSAVSAARYTVHTRATVHCKSLRGSSALSPHSIDLNPCPQNSDVRTDSPPIDYNAIWSVVPRCHLTEQRLTGDFLLWEIDPENVCGDSDSECFAQTIASVSRTRTFDDRWCMTVRLDLL